MDITVVKWTLQLYNGHYNCKMDTQYVKWTHQLHNGQVTDCTNTSCSVTLK